MALTAMVPLAAPQGWFWGDAGDALKVRLLRADSGGIQDGMDGGGIGNATSPGTVLWDVEVPFTGGYGPDGYEAGLAMAGTASWRWAATPARVCELDVGTASWESVAAVTVSTPFKWAIVQWYGYILAGWEWDTAQTLTAQKLAIPVAESSVISGCYPIARLSQP